MELWYCTSAERDHIAMHQGKEALQGTLLACGSLEGKEL